MINRNIYSVKLTKVVSSGVRNNSAYYVVLINQDGSLKWISKNLRNDEDSEDTLAGEGQMMPVKVEFWNYDKMTLMGEYSVDFKTQQNYRWQFF